MKIKKMKMLFLILFMIGFTFMNAVQVLGEEKSASGGVSLSPAYVDLGIIKDKPESFKVTVMNKGKAVRLKAKVDNAENVKINITPEVFELSENEQKVVTVTLENVEHLKIGVYDLSLSFLSEAENTDSITVFGTNSTRLIFRKEGLVLATCNVKDIAPIQEIPFYSILCNFYRKNKTVDVVVEIQNKDTGRIVWQQQDTIMMKSYPKSGYYGNIDSPLLSTPWEYGDYIYRLTALQKDKVLLKYQKEFNVGEQKGKLVGVTTKDVQKGDLAEFKAIVKNIGTQNLPVSVQIMVKDKKHRLIYDDIKTNNLPVGATTECIFQWPTKYTKCGPYSIDYTIIMGDQEEVGTVAYTVYLPCWVWWAIALGILLVIIFFTILFRKGCLRKICNKK